MNWTEYFEKNRGAGFLATASRAGKVNVAVYSCPKVMADGTLAFGMPDRITHVNLQENPHAVFAFQEKGFQGVRIYLEKVREETRGPVLEEVRDRANAVAGPCSGEDVRYLVLFRVSEVLPLVGAEAPRDEEFPGMV